MTDHNETQVGNTWAASPQYQVADIIAEYNNSAQNYDKASEEWNYRGAIDGAQFMHRHVAATADILDAGCGTGLVGQELYDLGMTNLHGIDLSPSMLAIAKERNVYKEPLLAGNICKTHFDSDTFDALISIAVLTHLPNIELAFQEFERVVKPKGLIAFSHRVDLEDKCGFNKALQSRLNGNRWSIVETTKPQPYYPKKPDYADRILIRYHAYRCWY